MKSVLARLTFIFVALSIFVQTSHAQRDPVRLPTIKPAELRVESAERGALRLKIGQLLLIGFQGNDKTDRPVQRLAEQIEGGEIGGILFLGHNISRSGDDIKDTLAFLKNKQSAGEHPGLLIALDQEGGKIQRLKPWHGVNKLPSAKNIVRQSADQAYGMYRDLACELADLGFNWNLGPVIDLASNPKNPVITRLQRAYSDQPETVSLYGSAFVRAHKACGVATSLKHFPGHGSSGTDSHKGLADITDTWRENELTPYSELIADGAGEAVMVGHLMHRDVDLNLPSSLSPAWIDGKLRSELGYQGLVLTDDLDMRAISDAFPPEAAAVAALIAGNDIIMIANGIERLNHLPRLVANAILDEMETDGTALTPARMQDSFDRVRDFKAQFGLLE